MYYSCGCIARLVLLADDFRSTNLMCCLICPRLTSCSTLVRRLGLVFGTSLLGFQQQHGSLHRMVCMLYIGGLFNLHSIVFIGCCSNRASAVQFNYQDTALVVWHIGFAECSLEAGCCVYQGDTDALDHCEALHQSMVYRSQIN